MTLPPMEVLERFGLAVYLALFFSVGIFTFSVWLVRHLLKQWESERAEHQEFMSNSVKANTGAIVSATDRLADLGGMIRSLAEQLARLETANRYQRDEHSKHDTMVASLQRDLAVLSEKIR